MKLRFYKHYWLYLLFSLLMIIVSAWSLFTYRLLPGLDFTGGSMIEIDYSPSASPSAALATSSATAVTETTLREALTGEFALDSIQSSGPESFIIRGPTIDNARKDELLLMLQTEISPDITVTRFETIGPVLGRELLEKTFIAIAIVAVVLVLYLRSQFKELKYGVCALIGVIHDAFILIGLFSLLGHFAHVEVDSLFVTAVLTTISSSVHDTIVIYDRIRELSRRLSGASYPEVVETAILQTMTRSLNNSLAIVFMLSALVMMGGPTIHWFAFALLAGVVLGTYSSPFVCTPLLLLWEDIASYRQKLLSSKKITLNSPK